MVLQEDNVIFISTVRFSNAVYIDTDQKIKQICIKIMRVLIQGGGLKRQDPCPANFRTSNKDLFSVEMIDRVFQICTVVVTGIRGF